MAHLPQMTVHVLADHASASEALAQRLLAFVAARPRAVLALPSGQTPVALYAHLVAARERFAKVTVFALDEYRGLSGSDPRSFRAFFEQHVFGPLGIGPERGFVLEGAAPDPLAECARYEAAIAAAGGLDLTLLGLGENGHIAFNEPGETLVARTHVGPLAPPANEVASEGLTMGVGTLLGAPEVWLIATGAKKAEAVRQLVEGEIDPRWPASLLRVHPRVSVYLDEAAASRLDSPHL